MSPQGSPPVSPTATRGCWGNPNPPTVDCTHKTPIPATMGHKYILYLSDRYTCTTHLSSHVWTYEEGTPSGKLLLKSSNLSSPGHSSFQCMGWQKEDNGNWLPHTRQHSMMAVKHVPYCGSFLCGKVWRLFHIFTLYLVQETINAAEMECAALAYANLQVHA